ncbi:hypothetical protein PTI98_003935 [Pleurotus ostreatus]|nr:hypothetical protein PTI98_003935 [Pleurotus ostreatus]
MVQSWWAKSASPICEERSLDRWIRIWIWIWIWIWICFRYLLRRLSQGPALTQPPSPVPRLPSPAIILNPQSSRPQSTILNPQGLNPQYQSSILNPQS